MNSYSGEMAQVRIPLEPEQREQVTEKNKSISTVVRGIFYEGTQPHLVNLISIRNLNCDFPHFQFDLTVRGSFCVHRFVDDVGLKLGTFARVNLLDLIRFGDITVDDCLQKHQLYSEEIRQCLKKSRKKYKSIRLEYVSSKREPSHTSPW